MSAATAKPSSTPAAHETALHRVRLLSPLLGGTAPRIEAAPTLAQLQMLTPQMPPRSLPHR